LGIVKQPQANLVFAGRTNGVLLDIGHDMVQAYSVGGDLSAAKATVMCNAGKAIASELQTALLNDSNSSNIDDTTVRYIKEKYARVAQASLDHERAAQHEPAQFSYTLPDGTLMNVSYIEHCMKPVDQVLFESYGDNSSIQEQIYNVVECQKQEYRRDLYGKIVLAGGTSLIPGLSQRLKHELKQLVPVGYGITIIAKEDRLYSSWLGAAAMCCSTCSLLVPTVTKQEYEEKGAELCKAKFQ